MNRVSAALLVILAPIAGCAHQSLPVKPGAQLHRTGDEIVIAGQFYHTGAPVVTWMDEGGYDAYRTERRFVPWDRADFLTTAAEAKYNKEHNIKNGTEVETPNRYGLRFAPSTRPTPTTRQLTPAELEKVRGGGWPLSMLQDRVDQFVIHFDVDFASRTCFKVLHDVRDLSVHFMLDVDGTIYQTLDVKERAWQATIANNRSVGIEIANIGCYRVDQPEQIATLHQYYRKDANGHTQLVPGLLGKAGGVRTPNFIARPAREDAVVGEIQHHPYEQYDLTPQQYDSLIKLTATLCTVLPNIKCDYPKDSNRKLITHTLTPEQWQAYQGVLGHYHVQDNKQDPGPAFQWDRVINGARKLMNQNPLPPGDPYEQQPALAKK